MPNLTKPAPTVSIMPVDGDVARTYFAPPISEFIARNVERDRGHQMIEDDGVLFAPAEAGNCFQIVIVKKMTRQAGAARRTIQQAINEFRGREQNYRRHFRELQQNAWVHSRSHPLA